jgi:hypothetical protein
VKKLWIPAVLVVLAAALVVAGVLWMRGSAEDELRSRVVAELQERLGGEVELGRARIAGRDSVVLEDLAWMPDGGVIAAVTVDRIELLVDASTLLEGEPVLAGGEILSPTVRLRRSRPSIEEEQPEVDDTLPSESPLRRLTALTGEPLPDELGDAVRRVCNHVAPGIAISVVDGRVTGLPRDLVWSSLGGQLAFGADELELGLDGELGQEGEDAAVGLTSLSVVLAPDQPVQGAVTLDELPLEAIATDLSSSEGSAIRGGDLHVSLATPDDPGDGQPRFIGTLEVTDADVRVEELEGFGMTVTTGHQFEVLPRGDSLEIDSWRWSVNGVSGVGSCKVLSLGDAPEIRLVLQLVEVPFASLLDALPVHVLPDEWGLFPGGTLDLTVRLNGPLNDRSAWDVGWKGDWSRVSVRAAGVGGAIADLRGSFSYSVPSPDGGVWHRVMGPEDPHFIGLGLVNPHILGAVVVSEDASFYKHKGFDERELREAILENIREPGSGRGGSTITQQVAKNLFLSGERSLPRKLQEAVLAHSIESTLDKSRILEIYLNLAQFGPGIHGIRDAAHHYFGTSTRQLNTLECIFLATMLPSPERYHDYYHPQGTVSVKWDEHMREVLYRMRSQGYITDHEYGVAQYQTLRFTRCDRFGSPD